MPAVNCTSMISGNAWISLSVTIDPSIVAWNRRLICSTYSRSWIV